MHLMIPAINVNTSIQKVGITPDGEMEVPSNIGEVGWFKLGSPPGEKGSACLLYPFPSPRHPKTPRMPPSA